MQTKIIKIYKKKSDIKEITDWLKNYSFENIEKHSHFEFSIIEKMTDVSFLSEIFPKTDLVKSIEL